MTRDRILIWTASLFSGCFALSLALYCLVPGPLTRTVLKFPDEVSRVLVSEARSLPFNWDKEHNVELLVREILLGPSRHDHLRLFSRQAGLRTILVREGNIYIDLEKESFLPDADVIYSPSMALEVLRATLLDNFPGVKNVSISVGGEPVRDLSLTKGEASI